MKGVAPTTSIGNIDTFKRAPKKQKNRYVEPFKILMIYSYIGKSYSIKENPKNTRLKL